MRTKPVSAKTMANRMAYVAFPCSAMMALRCLSRWSTKSVNPAFHWSLRSDYACSYMIRVLHCDRLLDQELRDGSSNNCSNAIAKCAGSCTIHFTNLRREPEVPLHSERFVLDAKEMWPGVHL